MADPSQHGDPAYGVANAAAIRRRMTQMHNRSMFLLLVLLVGIVFIAPALVDPEGPWWRYVNDVFVMLILVSGVIAVAEHRKLAKVLIGLTVVVVVVHSGAWMIPHTGLAVIRDVSTFCALFVLSFAVGINVFARGHALDDRVFGAIVLYLLLGVMWAFAYSMLGVLVPDGFAGGSGHARVLSEWVYFSFVTLTTVGYGDITPVARAARSLAMLEALVGQLYPAIIIARIVSLPVEPQ
jgi:hypothetical protein